MKEILGNVALWPAEQLINAAIRSDKHVQNKLAPFTGKAIQISTKFPPLPIRVVIESDCIRLTAIDSRQFALAVDASITGSASVLLGHLFDSSSRKALVGEEISLDGDVQLIQDLLTTLKSLDIEWQDYLAPVLGDVLTQQLSHSLAESRAWASDSSTRVRNSLDDYLKEEARWLPHEQQLRNFSDDLDNLRLQIDRVQARTERLRQRLASLPSSTAADATP